MTRLLTNVIYCDITDIEIFDKLKTNTMSDNTRKLHILLNMDKVNCTYRAAARRDGVPFTG